MYRCIAPWSPHNRRGTLSLLASIHKDSTRSLSGPSFETSLPWICQRIIEAPAAVRQAHFHETLHINASYIFR